jgi:hypothetical protein
MTHNLKASYLRAEGQDIFDIVYLYNNQPIRVWRDGNFYRLAEAQTNGFLTTSNLEQIAEIHENYHDRVYGLDGSGSIDRSFWL